MEPNRRAQRDPLRLSGTPPGPARPRKAQWGPVGYSDRGAWKPSEAQPDPAWPRRAQQGPCGPSEAQHDTVRPSQAQWDPAGPDRWAQRDPMKPSQAHSNCQLGVLTSSDANPLPRMASAANRGQVSRRRFRHTVEITRLKGYRILVEDNETPTPGLSLAPAVRHAGNTMPGETKREETDLFCEVNVTESRAVSVT